MNTARFLPSRSGEKIAALGQRTWHFAHSPANWDEEVTSIRLGVDLGMPMIGTAEMYSNGSAEVLVSGAIAGRHSEVFPLDKVLPRYSTRVGTVRTCEASLGRLGIDETNLHVLHWRNRVPLVETVEGFDELELDAIVPHWGVSNFDIADVIELTGAPGGDAVMTSEILYLTRRGPEYALPQWLSQLGIPTMADSPIEQGRLLGCPALQPISLQHNVVPNTLRWSGHFNTTVSTLSPAPERFPTFAQKAAARDIELTRDDLHTLDRVRASYPAAFTRSSVITPPAQVLRCGLGYRQRSSDHEVVVDLPDRHGTLADRGCHSLH